MTAPGNPGRFFLGATYVTITRQGGIEVAGALL